ncbi:hypothetical protein GCM10025768_00680 [Microbacterium pseudoresistens]|uniref:Uncharacterized protein n=1 Tax=Microbacterium pseudoresistens TaxID=640634 RepID=A0A7Y9JMV2_9MICO|nr:hypothetical protein [Microbacterium pseudoresistens]NYD53903.1 hypothetical protein [Microbacterium pseudoresistens]
MTNHSPHPATRAPLPWLLILGLSSLSLLWPLTALLGFDDGGPRALLIIAVIALTWVGVVGFGRVPRPLLVLTLVGVGHGLITMIVSAVMGGGERPFFTYLVALVLDAFWGLLAGVVAFAIQQMRGPRA